MIKEDGYEYVVSQDAASCEIDPKPKCPRCGDLFYDPKTMIEDEKQRAAEWEKIAKDAESRLMVARRALEIARDALNII